MPQSSVPIDGSWDHPTTPADIQREIPGSAIWSERHRFLFGFAVMIPILLFTGVILAVSRIH